MDNLEIQEASFESLRFLYSELKDNHTKLENYTQILQAILKYYDIPHPTYDLFDPVDF